MKLYDNWFIKLIARRRKEPAISETIYYNCDLKAESLFRRMWLFDRYAALVQLRHPELFVQKIVGSLAVFDREEYCNKIRRDKIKAAKSKITRIEREGWVPDLFGDNERSYRERLRVAQKALSMWESDGWEVNIELPVRYINRIRVFK